jgi:hypothetical protein
VIGEKELLKETSLVIGAKLLAQILQITQHPSLSLKENSQSKLLQLRGAPNYV